VGGLDKILHVDVWAQLHPVTKLVVKILQHLRSKIDDMAEVRLYESDSEILVTTYKSEIRITPVLIEFVRKTADGALRVQRARFKENREIFEALKREIELVVVHNAEPNYSLVVEVLEKYLKPEE
jgi:hypothetical protein